MKLIPWYNLLKLPEDNLSLFPKSDNLSLFPKSIQLNLTNACYSKCIGCRKYEWPTYELSFTNIVTILDFMKKNNGHSIILSGGEPCKHAMFNQICELIKTAGLAVGVLTSAIYKPSVQFEHTDWLSISIDGSTRELYKRTRGVDALDTVIHNVKTIKSTHPHIKVRCNATISNVNFHDMTNILHLCESLHIDCNFFPIHTWADLQLNSAELDLSEISKLLLAASNSTVNTNAADFLFLLQRKKPEKCIVPYFHAFIDADGEVFPCCRVANDNGAYESRNLSVSLGNISSGMHNIWNSDKSKNIRQKLFKNPSEPECTFCDRYNKINLTYCQYRELEHKPIFL